MTIGINGSFMLKQETVYGTKATPDVSQEIKSEGFVATNNLIQPVYVSNSPYFLRTLMGPLDASGSVAIDLTPEGAMGWLLKGLFGSVSSSLVATGVYDHTFTPAITLPSFTIQTDRVGACIWWIGSVIQSMDINITTDALLEATVNWVCQQPETNTAETPSFSLLDPWTAYEVAIDLNGVSDLMFRNLSLNISRESEGDRTLNTQRYISGVTPKMFSMNGSFELEFDDADQWERFLGAIAATSAQKTQDSQALTITITSTDAITGAYYYSLTFNIYEFYIEDANAPISAPNDRILQTVNFVTNFNQSESKLLNCVLRNSEDEYADPS